MQKNNLLIPFITAGYPSKKLFLPILKTLSKHDTNYIEVGVPHSDPLADGPTIQHASKIALENGVNLTWIVETLRATSLQKKLKPLILFSYFNPILNYGFEKLLRDLPKPLFYGLIIPDLPLEEAKKYLSLFKNYKLNLISLIAPTTNKKKIKEIARLSSGLIYLVSTTGTTGVRKNISPELKEKIQEIKHCTKTPIVVGFGISNLKQAKKIISLGADGVVIGSAIINLLNNTKKLQKFISSLKNGEL